MEMVSTKFPVAVSCDRMTRGMKRLLEQGELLSSQKKKDDGHVNVEVRRCNGKKYVRVFRSPNKDNVNVNKQRDEVDTAEISNESALKKTQNFAQEINSVSAFLLHVLYQIKNKCLSSTAQNDAKALPSVGDKNLGIAL
ncbi:Hypothetical predicted protein [Paramuricea clavata]|uniref:Uncharacterized protein n=1 Tax=Paramuricea clavata TaxID=317549 RepID=A0A6S7JZM0_PARCT|nr:Hypothetical predicted protein [Paramuricea clavata]